MRLAAVSILAFLTLAAPLVSGERGEQVLAWDDGGVFHAMYPYPAEGRQIAVMFQAPEGFTWLQAVHCFICNDQMTDPEYPWLPTTGPRVLAVWGPQDVGGQLVPGSESAYEFDSGEQYQEDTWIEFALPEAVDLSASATFPDRVFFVGIKWLSVYDPILGIDWDPIVSGNTVETFSSEWERYSEGSAAIRAVVSDTSGTPVELESWGSVKSRYQMP